MIIRRKHTANYTTIGNALFNDERLAADEVGILAFLLSRPNDWEVRRPALMRRWKIGRDGMKRVMTNWMRTGWCRAEKTRLANGTFHIVYEIRDEPGPELSIEDIRKALSLVSSEASDDEIEDKTEAETGGSQEGVTHPPPTPQPGVADQRAARRGSSIEDSLSTDSIRTESTKAVRGFVDVKAKWPAEHVLSDVAAQSAFLGFIDIKKEAAFQGIRPYLDDCRVQNRKVCDLTTYLREERWSRFLARSQENITTALITAGTPQWFRWHEHYLAVGDEQKYRTMESREKRGLPYDAPSEWPPALPKSAETNLSKTG